MLKWELVQVPPHYEVLIGPRAIEKLPPIEGRLAVIVDSEVERLHGDTLRAAWSHLNCLWLPVPGGESCKSLSRAEALYGWLAHHRLERSEHVVAVGGGALGDLVGFVAATWMRGLPFIQVPTTLLAQVDSSVGGKVAVNHAAGKNLIGAFHQPEMVLADTRFLNTLPLRQLHSGLAEVVKTALLAGEPLLSQVNEFIDDLLSTKGRNLDGGILKHGDDSAENILKHPEIYANRDVLENRGEETRAQGDDEVGDGPKPRDIYEKRNIQKSHSLENRRKPESFDTHENRQFRERRNVSEGRITQDPGQEDDTVGDTFQHPDLYQDRNIQEGHILRNRRRAEGRNIHEIRDVRVRLNASKGRSTQGLGQEDDTVGDGLKHRDIYEKRNAQESHSLRKSRDILEDGGVLEHRWPSLIAGCVAYKAEIVRQDPNEQGRRAVLNFGHTLGHALEALGNLAKESGNERDEEKGRKLDLGQEAFHSLEPNEHCVTVSEPGPDSKAETKIIQNTGKIKEGVGLHFQELSSSPSRKGSSLPPPVPRRDQDSLSTADYSESRGNSSPQSIEPPDSAAVGEAHAPRVIVPLLHGEAVAWGMKAALLLSGFAHNSREFQLVSKLPLPPLPKVEFDTILELMKGDKKSKDGQLNWVLLESPGVPEWGCTVKTAALKWAWEMLKRS